MKRNVLTSLMVLAVAACASVETTRNAEVGAPDPDLRRQLEADVRFLASDRLQGRDAGSPGYDIAADYVAARFAALGLEPGGEDDTYFQPIKLVSWSQGLPGGAKVSVNGEAWEPKVDFIGGGQATGTLRDVPIVFAGYGFVSDDHGRDDFEGLDVEGKIVATISGAPKFLDPEERAHFRRQRTKNAADRGAVGTISILLPSYEESVRTFETIAARVDDRTSVGWANEDGERYNATPTIRAGLTLGQKGAERLITAAGRDWAAIAELAETEAGEVAGFDTGLTATIETVVEEGESFTSSNVVGILPGTDPKVQAERIAVTAHLDHIGTKARAEEGEDDIYNGAMDNAVGVAGIMNIAARLKANPPRRSVIFIALAAEEKGLIGSRYFVENYPETAPPLVANFNFDMPILHKDFTDIVVFGLSRTTMAPLIKQEIAAAGLTSKPDPYPEQGFFTRSDHYSFVRAGIPAAYIDQATREGEDADAETQTFLRTIYHKTTDEADLVYYDDLARFAALNASVVYAIGNQDQKPLWVKDDFFGRVFEGPMAGE